MKANVLGGVRCLPARTVPQDIRGGDVSLIHERLNVRIDGVANFERREKKERKQTTQGRDGRTVHRHHTGIF